VKPVSNNYEREAAASKSVTEKSEEEKIGKE
jgi:hypothetical protein